MKQKISIGVVLIIHLILYGCAPGEQFTTPTESLTPEIIPTPTESFASETIPTPTDLYTPENIPATTATITSSQPETPRLSERMEVTQMPERIPTDDFEHEDGITGEAPQELVDRIISDLQQKTGSTRQSIQVIRAQAVVWNDGSLGCPKPGEFYTQALVNGFHIILKIEDNEYDYRASQTGYFFLCEGGARLIPSEGTTDS
jgi:hypothetical protein